MENIKLVEISKDFMENMKYKINPNIILVHNTNPKNEQDHITNLERIHVFNTKNKVYNYIELFKLEYNFLKKVFSEEKIEKIMKSYTLNDLLWKRIKFFFKKCKEKKQFETKEEVRKKVEEIKKESGNVLNEYRSHICKKYHLTSKTRKEMENIKKLPKKFRKWSKLLDWKK